MRFGKMLLVCVVLMSLVLATTGDAEAQRRMRPSTLRRPVQRSTTARSTNPVKTLKNTAKAVQLSPMIEPAVGPSGAQGVASIYYNDVDTSLNSGNLVVTGLPTGRYFAWLVFFDPFTKHKQAIHSELIAQFSVHQNTVRTETGLMFGLPSVINISHAKQLVVTKSVLTKAQVGGQPICGAAGYPNGPAANQAVLVGNIQ